MSSGYRVVVQKDYLKFSAAHFIAYKGFREPLHGHNYQVGHIHNFRFILSDADGFNQNRSAASEAEYADKGLDPQQQTADVSPGGG